MALKSLTVQEKEKIHNIIYDYGKQYIPVQELTHVASEIINEPTEETILEMQTYLNQFPYQRLGQPGMMPTTQTRALAGNDMRFAFAEVRKIISDDNTSDESI